MENNKHNALEVRDLTVAYREKPVLWDIDLTVPTGVLMAIVGPNGAGKTTLMEMLKAHLEKSGERTLFLNLDIEWDRPHFDSQAALIKKIELEIGRQHGYVFIDEIPIILNCLYVFSF